jgi:hypothetical protein
MTVNPDSKETKEGSIATSTSSAKLLFGITIAALTFCAIVLIFTTSSQISDRFTAAATILLALTTFWLGVQTREAVRVSEDEMRQNRQTLKLAQDQAKSAELSARILAESNRPFISMTQGTPIGIKDVDGFWQVDIPLNNYGASVAFLETGVRGPSAILARGGDHFMLGTPDTVVIPKDTGATVSFSAIQASPGRMGGPVMRPDGTFIALALDYWFMDASRETHYSVHAEFDAVEVTGMNSRFVAGLRLTKIDFGPPLPINIDAPDPGSLPQSIIDRVIDN